MFVCRLRPADTTNPISGPTQRHDHPGFDEHPNWGDYRRTSLEDCTRVLE